MAFSISNTGRLLLNGRQVERIPSPVGHTNGAWSRAPNILIMHFTYGGTARSSAHWFSDPNNRYKSSAHVVIERDGTVVQCVDFTVGANHAGKSSWHDISGFNDKSYSIELANWGYLRKTGANWSSYTGVSIGNPILAEHKNGNPDRSKGPIGWEAYPAAQIEAAVGIAAVLVSQFGVDTILGHDDISIDRKWDPGPAFDMTRFRNRLLPDRALTGPNILTVRSSTGLNLRKGPGLNFDVISNLADQTLVSPIESDGNWVMVNVLDAAFLPQLSGWVHNSFLV